MVPAQQLRPKLQALHETGHAGTVMEVMEVMEDAGVLGRPGDSLVFRAWKGSPFRSKGVAPVDGSEALQTMFADPQSPYTILQPAQ